MEGQVDGKTSGKSLAKTAIALNTVEVYNAQDGAKLGGATINPATGSFSGLTFTLPATKTILVFKATVAQGTFLSVVPIDLSNLPAAGVITGSNPISIVISQQSTDIAQVVSSMLGLAGDLGDTGMTLNAAGSSYTAAAQVVVDYGGQQLAYSGAGLAMTGKFTSAALLPAQDASTLSLEQLNSMTLDGEITAVSIPGNKPIVSFIVKNAVTGKGVRGLRTFNLVIAQLKPEANGSPSEWLSYHVASATSRPGTDSGYTVIDNGDGSYSVSFGKDIKTAGTNFGAVYDATRTHRVMVGLGTTPSVVAQPSGTNLSNFYNEKYLLKDFIPATPTVAPTVVRDITTTAACNECHTKIGVSTPHGGRGDVKYCMMCHTAQRGNGRTNLTSVNGVVPARDPLLSGTSADANYVADGEVFGDMVTMTHKIHMGSRLTKTGYNYAQVKFNDIHYPKAITNCRQCHKGDNAAQLLLAPQANNWKDKPSRKACGACHDNVNFAAGTSSRVGATVHNNTPMTDDSSCLGCHGSDKMRPVEKAHLTTLPTLNNPNVYPGFTNFTYEIAEVAVNASNQAVIKFRIMSSTDGSAPAAVVFGGTGTTAAAPLTGFTGSPGFLLAYNKSATNQPFTASPDYNNLGVKAAQPIAVSLGSLLVDTGGVALLTPDSSGYYTATITAAASNFPSGALMRTVALQGTFTQTGAEALANRDFNNDGDKLDGVARNAISVQKTVTGDTVRRKVVDSAKCANCHEWFLAHGGSRVYEVQVCVMCHGPNLSSSGKGANKALIDFYLGNPVNTAFSLVNPLGGSNITGTTSASVLATMEALNTAVGNDPTTYPEETNNMKDMIHGIHAGGSRTTPLKFVRDRGTSGVYIWDFGFVKYPGILKRCDTCHTGASGYNAIPAGARVTTDTTTDGGAITTADNVVIIDAARKTLPNATDLVTTPYTASCVSCHDLPTSVSHMRQNGGQIKVPRSQANPNGESCLTCHGTTGAASIFNAHRY